MLVRNCLAETGLDLTSDVEVVEDGQTAFIELHHVCTFWSDKADVVVHFLIDIGIVDVDILVAWVEEVAKHTYRSARFLINKCRQLLGLLDFAKNVFPTGNKDLHFSIQFTCALSFSHSTDNDAAVFRLDAFDDLL